MSFANSRRHGAIEDRAGMTGLASRRWGVSGVRDVFEVLPPSRPDGDSLADHDPTVWNTRSAIRDHFGDFGEEPLSFLSAQTVGLHF
jgi:hypothetical protein